MGRLQAEAMSEAMSEASISLEAQLGWHLTSNHYPPVPDSMIPVCIEAIDNANEGEWDKLVSLPEGVGYKGLTVAPTHAIVEQHHLDNWIIESELD